MYMYQYIIMNVFLVKLKKKQQLIAAKRTLYIIILIFKSILKYTLSNNIITIFSDPSVNIECGQNKCVNSIRQLDLQLNYSIKATGPEHFLIDISWTPLSGIIIILSCM